MNTADWLPLPDPPLARLRLVCFAHSGSGVAPFIRWRTQMPSGVALCPVRLPGREGARSPLLRDVTAIVETALSALATRPELPTVLLGHSLGAVLAYEVARELQTRGAPPQLLVVSGRHAPEHQQNTRLAELPDAAFLDAIASRYGGIPAAVRAEPEMMALMLPILRADLAAAESWRAHPEPRWRGSTWVVHGDSDRALDPSKIDDWRGNVDGPVEITRLPGDHFYLYDAKSGFLPLLLSRLTSLLAQT